MDFAYNGNVRLFYSRFDDGGQRIEEESIMKNILNNLAEMIKVKTIITLVVLSVFATLALRSDIGADNVMVIVSTVVAFYFGTQHEKKQ